MCAYVRVEVRRCAGMHACEQCKRVYHFVNLGHCSSVYTVYEESGVGGVGNHESPSPLRFYLQKSRGG